MGFEAKRLCKLALGPVLLLMSVIAMAAGGDVSEYNLSPGVPAVGHEIYNLHMVILGICVVIGLAVFAVMFYSIIYHRKSPLIVCRLSIKMPIVNAPISIRSR